MSEYNPCRKPEKEEVVTYNISAASPASAAITLRDLPFGEADYAAFQRRVEAKTRIRLSEYKADQMQRRISTLAEKAGCTSFTAYAAVMEREFGRLAEFLDRMTINVTELLRNPIRFEELASAILPELLARRPGLPLSVWSAGCSYGAEAYTMAMLLHEISPTTPHRVKGTDLDLAVLSKAERACFSEADMLNIHESRREAHFHEVCGGYQPKIHLRSKVRFAPHDLLAGPYPKAEYDLILCRNVVIYFTDEAKDRIYQGFFHSLRPGGILFVGGTERLSNHRAVGFDLVRPFFYRKPL